MIRTIVYIIALGGLALGCSKSSNTNQGSGGSGASRAGSGGGSAASAGASGSSTTGGSGRAAPTPSGTGGSGSGSAGKGAGGGAGSSGSSAVAGRSGGSGSGASGSGTAGSSASAGSGGGAAGSSASGSSVSGSVNGKSFTTVTTALYAGMPDSAASTVVFLFEAAVQCSEISGVGWDKRIMNGSQALELKMMGTTPMVYTVTTSATPAPGEASVNHAIAMATGTPPETSASAGTVTLSAITPMVSAVGSYDLTYPNGSLKGSFNAVYCPGGVEP